MGTSGAGGGARVCRQPISPLDLGILKRMVVAREHRYCGKEFTGRSRLSQGKPNFYVVTAYWYTVHGARIEQSICLIVIQQESSPDAGIPQAEGRGRGGTPASSTATPAFVRAPDSSRLSRPTIESSGPQPAPPNAVYRRKAARSSFKTALELARTFPFGVLASQACPYRYDTG